MKYCKKCGKELKDSAKFCTGCGTKYFAEDIEEKPEAPKAAERSEAELDTIKTAERLEAEPDTAKTAERSETEPDTAKTAERSEAEPDTAKTAERSETEPGREAEWKLAEKLKSIPKKKIYLFSGIALGLIVIVIIGISVLQWYTSAEQQVLRALDAGDYTTALSAMEEVEAADGSEAMADQLKKRIDEVKTDFSEGNMEYEVAILKLETIKKFRVKSVSSALSETESYINKLNASRTNFSTAESFYSTGNYGSAISHYRQVIEEDENYETAMTKLSDSIEKYREEALSKAKEYADAELYSDALTLLEEALTVIPNDTKLTEQSRIYEKNDADKQKADALSEAAAQAQSGNYLGAMKALNSVMQAQASDAELLTAYNGYCDKYAAQVIATAEEKAADKDFESAISVLNAALREVPGNKKLSEELDAVKAKKPVSITSLLAVNISDSWSEWNTGSPTDPFGNDYSSACNYVIIDGVYRRNKNYYVEYRLYGKYSTLTGTIATHIDNPEDKVNRLQVYVDDVLVYTSEDLNRKTDAIDFSVDVSGADYIKIVLYVEGAAILSNVQLWP